MGHVLFLRDIWIALNKVLTDTKSNLLTSGSFYSELLVVYKQ